MSPSTQVIFDRFQIRKTKKQKTQFIQWVVPYLQSLGYPVQVERGEVGVRNIVIGDLEKANVVFTAHYDTCAVLPFPNFITPKCISLFLAYQFLLVIALFALVCVLSFIAGLVNASLGEPIYYMSIIALIGLIAFGPANRHTANDNTSGVTGILDLEQAMPEELREKAAFVLFDLEEAGMIGSSCFAKAHRKTMKDKLLINFDCISDGATLFLGLKRGSRKYLPILTQAYIPDNRMEPLFSIRHHIYPSDQMNFPCGVGVAALKKTRFGLLYMDRIHTNRDTVYTESNISFVVEGSVRLTELL